MVPRETGTRIRSPVKDHSSSSSKGVSEREKISGMIRESTSDESSLSFSLTKSAANLSLILTSMTRVERRLKGSLPRVSRCKHRFPATIPCQPSCHSCQATQGKRGTRRECETTSTRRPVVVATQQQQQHQALLPRKRSRRPTDKRRFPLKAHTLSPSIHPSIAKRRSSDRTEWTDVCVCVCECKRVSITHLLTRDSRDARRITRLTLRLLSRPREQQQQRESFRQRTE